MSNFHIIIITNYFLQQCSAVTNNDVMMNVSVLSLFSLRWSLTFLLTIVLCLIIFNSVTNKLGVDAKISCSTTFE